MWRFINGFQQRAAGLKCGFDTKAAVSAVLPQDAAGSKSFNTTDEFESIPFHRGYHTAPNFWNCLEEDPFSSDFGPWTREQRETFWFNDRPPNRRPDYSSDVDHGQRHADAGGFRGHFRGGCGVGEQRTDNRERGRSREGRGARQNWNERWNMCRHDMWNCSSSWHFLEAVGWGTAVILGLQVSELCHERSKWKQRQEKRDACACLLVRLREAASHAALWCHSQNGILARNIIPRSAAGLESGASLASVNHLPGDVAAFSTAQWSSLPLSSANVIPSVASSVMQSVSVDMIAEGNVDVKVGDVCETMTSTNDECDVLEEVASNLRLNSTETTDRTETHILAPVTSTDSIPETATTTRSLTDQRDSFSSLQQQLNDIFCNYWATEQNSQAIAHARRGNVDRAVAMWKEVLTYSPMSDKVLFNLGVCYQRGLGGVERDLDQARQCYQRAADLGNANAAYNLGLLLLELDSGQSVNNVRKERMEQVNEEMQSAVALLTQAAEQGLAEAQRELGVLKVEMNSEASLKEAAELFEKASEQNDMTAQYYMGLCHERGLGVERNLNKAAACYKRSASQGHALALFNLACFYENGLGGLPVSEKLALELYKSADASGVTESTERIHCLEEKLIVIPSPTSSIDERRNEEFHFLDGMKGKNMISAGHPSITPSSSNQSLFRFFSDGSDIDDPLSDDDGHLAWDPFTTRESRLRDQNRVPPSKNKLSFSSTGTAKARGGIFLDFSSDEEVQSDDGLFHCKPRGLVAVGSDSSIVFEEDLSDEEEGFGSRSMAAVK